MIRLAQLFTLPQSADVVNIGHNLPKQAEKKLCGRGHLLPGLHAEDSTGKRSSDIAAGQAGHVRNDHCELTNFMNYIF